MSVKQAERTEAGVTMGTATSRSIYYLEETLIDPPPDNSDIGPDQKPRSSVTFSAVGLRMRHVDFDVTDRAACQTWMEQHLDVDRDTLAILADNNWVQLFVNHELNLLGLAIYRPREVAEVIGKERLSRLCRWVQRSYE